MNNSISCLNISNRAKQVLKRNGILTISELSTKTIDEISDIPYIGSAIIEELSPYVKIGYIYNHLNYYNDDLIFYFKYNDQIVDDINVRQLVLTPKIKRILRESHIELASQIIKNKYKGTERLTTRQLALLQSEINSKLIFKSTSDVAITRAIEIKKDFDNSFVSDFCGISLSQLIYVCSNSVKMDDYLTVKPLFIEQFLNALANKKSISLKALYENPSKIITNDRLKSILDYLECDKKLTLTDNIIYCTYISIDKYVDNIKDERIKSIITLRFSGETLESIGNKFDITRERVRQIVDKTIPFDDLNINEKQYVDYYKQYNFKKEEFTTIFGVSDLCYGCFYHFLSKGTKSISDFINNKNIDDVYKYKANQFSKMVIDGTAFINKYDVLDYYMKHMCTSPTPLNDIFNGFNNYVQSNDMFKFNGVRVLERILANNYMLSGKHKYRYFDKTEKEIIDFISKIDFSKYNNIEFSSYKIYIDNLKLVKDFGLLNEYELFDILKKFYTNNNVSYGKNPVLKFGNGDRVAQINAIIDKYGPISKSELIKKYSDLYGVKPAVVGACITPLVKNRLSNQKNIYV